jgi:hypothetical protein
MRDLADIEHYFQQRAQQDSFSGVVLVTQGDSQIFAGAYGYASRSWKIPNALTFPCSLVFSD